MDTSSSSSSSGMEEGSVSTDREDGCRLRIGEEGSNEEFEDENDDEDEDDMDEDEDDPTEDFRDAIEDVVHDLGFFGRHRRILGTELANPRYGYEDGALRDMLRNTMHGLVRSGSVSHFPRSIHFERLDADHHADEPLRLPSTRLREAHMREAHWHMRSNFRRSEPLAIHPSLRRRSVAYTADADGDENSSTRSSESTDAQTSSSVLRSISRMQSLAAEHNVQHDGALNQYVEPHVPPPVNDDEPSAAVSDPVLHDTNLGWIFRNRHIDRFSQGERDRERERIPAALLRRWTYHPFSDGGDVLPAMFDVSTPSRRHARGLDGRPLITVENHSSVTPLVEEVTQQFTSMLSDLRAVDEKVEKAEKKFESFIDAKNKEEEKQEKESKSVEEVQRVEIRDDEEGDENHASSQEMDDASQGVSQGSEAVPSNRSQEIARQSDEGQAEPGPGLQQAISRSAPGLGNIQEEVPLPDLVMDSIEVSRRRSTEQQRQPSEASPPENHAESQNQEQVSSAASEMAEAISSDAPQENGAANLDPPSNNISEVAAQRAAAAGISLDAPANVNPAVVAAATQSTGIDPAFLAALPEEMRTEILTQYYDSIRTNTNAQSGQTSAGATNINLDFLIALPPALRTEVLEMEAQFQSRQEAQNGSVDNRNPSNNAQGSQVAGVEMDNATFLATLPPELREEVLLTSGEAFIQSLPPHVAAEARLLQEREVNTRIPWGQQVSPYGSGRRGQGILRSGSNGRRERSRRLALPTLRWKKVDEGWLRELKDAENEPDAFLDTEGIASLVNLLWIRNPELGVEQIYQVFRFACRTTSTREIVLDELVKLVTSSDSEIPNADNVVNHAQYFEHWKLHATAVRRGLEILYMICSDDKIVSEFLLGLPQSPEELQRLITASSSEIIYKATSLSTLMTLMQSKLFCRSDSHMDQLIRLISLISTSIPPAKSTETVQLNRRRDRRHARMLVDRSSLSEPMGLFMVDVDDDVIFPMPEEEDDEDIDSYEDLFAIRNRMRNDNQIPPARETSDENERGDEEKDKDAEEEAIVSPTFRVPQLRESELVALTNVLLRSSFVNETHNLTSRSIGRLGELPENRKIFMSSLVTIAKKAGAGIEREYLDTVVELRAGSKSGGTSRKKHVLSAFSLGSNANDVTLLRVVKSLSELLKHEISTPESGKDTEAQENGDQGRDVLEINATDAEISEYRRSMSDGLSGVWTALDKLLEHASDETRVSTKVGKKASASTTPSVAEMLGPQRGRASSRALSPMLSRLSPVIEAFIVMHTVEDSETKSTDDPVPQSPLELAHGSPRSPSWKYRDASDGSDNRPWTVDDELASFVERHRVPINTLLRANPELLHTSFRGTLKHPHAIDFDNKKAYFRNTIRLRSSQNRTGSIKVSVRRERVLDDSYSQLRMRTPEEMKGRLHVQFTGEEGVDAGGVTREWYVILARQIFDPNYVLFTRSAAKAATYQPDKRSYINREHLETFRFVGRVIAKAIYDGQLIDAYFTRSFYKHILGMKPNFHDIEGQDPDYYKSLKWILENDCTGIIDYTMSAEYDEFGKQTVIDLIPNGRNIPVTEENKAEYVRLVTEVRMTKTIEKQIEAFKEGFYEIIPLEDCKIFNELELELLMSGLPDIDVSDLKANVEYTGYTASSPQVNWFWRCVSKMDQEDLARLVMFVTGTSKVPLEGFSQLQGMNGVQKFQIHRVSGDTMRLPSAHTCFNQLDLPEYSTADILSERLLRAVRECSVGFGFA
eukprot:TRINITY_DN771_c0_g1_i1.p1 TRINITY_DN771_c0_g1~~TRINITY_DN771_c0_g1_i1.p1  ORF type:complete len:1803 (+),score=292.16 TRINITY_DN771_c0_g1_i1:174-5411(+)